MAISQSPTTTDRIFVRGEPLMSDENVHSLVEAASDLAEQHRVNMTSGDSSPFRDAGCNAIIESCRAFFSAQLSTPVQIDFSFAATPALTDIILQINRIRRAQRKECFKIYIDTFPDQWELSPIREVCDQLGIEATSLSEEADILFLTHGTPDMGYTSLERFNTANIDPEQYVVIDSAGEWPSLLGNRWIRSIRDILEHRQGAIVGDFQKVMGCSFRHKNGSIPVNSAFTLFSPRLWNLRITEGTKDSPLPKNKDQIEHWQRRVSRIITGEIPAPNIVYSLAFLEIFGDRLGEFSEIAEMVASKIRAIIGGYGDMRAICKKISHEELQANNPDSIFTVQAGDISLPVERVFPIAIAVAEDEQLYGGVKVFPIYAQYGEAVLYDIYFQIVRTLFGVNMD